MVLKTSFTRARYEYCRKFSKIIRGMIEKSRLKLKIRKKQRKTTQNHAKCLNNALSRAIGGRVVRHSRKFPLLSDKRQASGNGSKNFDFFFQTIKGSFRECSKIWAFKIILNMQQENSKGSSWKKSMHLPLILFSHYSIFYQIIQNFVFQRTTIFYYVNSNLEQKCIHAKELA